MPSLSLIIASASLITPAHAQQPTLVPGQFNEAVLPAAEISGALVAGVQARQAPSDETVVQAFIPAEWAGAAVCLRATSVDGRYVAQGDYKVFDDWAGGTISVGYESQHREVLSGLLQDQLGVRISLGSCADEGVGELTTTQWNASGTGAIDILVNSFQAEMVFAYLGDDPTPIRCSPLPDPLTVAFDTECRIEEAPAGLVEVEILRVVDQSAMPPTLMSIWFDDP